MAKVPGQPQAQTDEPSFWPVVYTICFGAFMAALDASIVTVALPTLQAYFHAPVASVEWVAIAYLITLSAMLVVFGRVADMVGRGRMYAVGFGVFIVGSAVCGASSTLAVLLVARVFQAAGAALLQANSVAIITARTPAKDRGKAIGVQGAAQALGLSVGPVVGGVILTYLGWRWMFYVNVPVGIVGTLLAVRFLPKDRTGEHQRFDYVGAALISVALVLFMFDLSQGYRVGWFSVEIIGSFVVMVALLAVFLAWERRQSQPVLDLGLFKYWAYTVGNITGALSYALMYGVLFLTPYGLKEVLGMAPAEIGLILAAVPLMMTISAPMAGRWADAYGEKGLTFGGMAIGSAGAFMLAVATPMRSVALFVVGLALVGLGMGLFTPPNNSSVMGVPPKDKLGMAGGFLNMTRSFGMSLGVAIGGTIFGSLLIARLGTESPSLAQASVTASILSIAYVVVGVLSTGAAVLSLLRPATSGAPSGEPTDLM